MKIIFFGTHEFAASILRGIIADPFFEIILVVSQPNRPVGRHQTIEKNPVALIAEKNHLTLSQPESLKEFILPNSELAIVAQYGLFIPARMLHEPIHGMLNIHPSLLPAYRGPTPIQTALINGDSKTGITIMQLDVGMDTGPILAQQTFSIQPTDTYASLAASLAEHSVSLLLRASKAYVKGEIIPTAQDERLASVCKLLTRDHGKIDWQKNAEAIYHQFQGLTPWPGIWCLWEKKRLKLLSIACDTADIPPGIVRVANGEIFIGTGHGSLRVIQLQLEGKKAMNAQTFLNGFRQFDGSRVE